jgi:serine/threonine protein kinase
VHQIELHEKIVHENILQFYGITKKETGMIKKILSYIKLSDYYYHLILTLVLFLSIPDTVYQMNKYILVMEYADSGTLSTYLNEHFYELYWNDKFQLAIQLASAVLCLHENNISHNNMVIFSFYKL